MYSAPQHSQGLRSVALMVPTLVAPNGLLFDLPTYGRI